MSDIIIAAIAFHLGLQHNQITQSINQIANNGIAKMIQKIDIKKSNPMILRINHTRATVFFSLGSSKLGVKCSSSTMIE